MDCSGRAFCDHIWRMYECIKEAIMDSPLLGDNKTNHTVVCAVGCLIRTMVFSFGQRHDDYDRRTIQFVANDHNYG